MYEPMAQQPYRPLLPEKAFRSFHVVPQMVRLKALAEKNMDSMSVLPATSHLETSALYACALRNISLKLVTFEVSQVERSELKAWAL